MILRLKKRYYVFVCPGSVMQGRKITESTKFFVHEDTISINRREAWTAAFDNLAESWYSKKTIRGEFIRLEKERGAKVIPIFLRSAI